MTKNGLRFGVAVLAVALSFILLSDASAQAQARNRRSSRGGAQAPVGASADKAGAAQTGRQVGAGAGTRGDAGARPARPREPMELANPVKAGEEAAQEKIWSGNSVVALKANDNPVINVFVARGGSVLVELPAKDRIFAIHQPPPDPEFLVLQDSPTRERDRSFLFRPGKDFFVDLPGKRRGPVATIGVQMRSGIYIVFQAFPVEDLGLNAHRVVVRYDPVAVAQERSAEGLETNLGTTKEEPRSSASSSVYVEDARAARPDAAAELQAKRLRDYAVAAGSELQRFSSIPVQRDAKQFPGLGSFGKEAAGLRVAAAEVKQLEGGARVAVVAVSNRGSEDVKIAPVQPSLVVETEGGNKFKQFRQEVKSLYVETNAKGGVVPARSTVFFVIVYESPGAMSSGQYLRAFVTSEKAVNKPAVVELARN